MIAVNLSIPVHAQNCCDAPSNLLTNGGFDGGGSQWATVEGTPQFPGNVGCLAPGATQLWGNQVAGEAIAHAVDLKAGYTYDLSACVRGTSPEIGPGNGRFLIRAATNSTTVNYTDCPTGDCEVIGVTGVLLDSIWVTECISNWTPKQDYDRIIINPINDSNAPDPDSISWGQMDDLCIRVVDSNSCENNIVANPDIEQVGGTTANWSELYGSPDFFASSVQIWGNQNPTIGEAVYQELDNPLIPGHTYRILMEVRHVDDPTKKPSSQFRVRGSVTPPSDGTCTTDCFDLGVSPNITQTSGWALVSMVYQVPITAPYLNVITLNVQNESNALNGDSTSLGLIGNICIVDKGFTAEVCCEEELNLLTNGAFSQGNDSWITLEGTPQFPTGDGCDSVGSAQLWGNLVAGEAIYQEVNIQSGRTYDLSFCAKHFDEEIGPGRTRCQIRVATNDPSVNYENCPPGECEVIAVTEILNPDVWVPEQFQFTAGRDYSRLIINPINDSDAPNPDSISWARIDDLCLQLADPANCVCPENILLNGGLLSNNNGTPAPNWNTSYYTPDFRTTAVGLWGNENPTIGEGIHQKLSSPLLPDHLYQVTMTVRNGNEPTKMPYAMFKVRASDGPLASAACTGNCEIMGISGPVSDPVNWTQESFTFWVPSGATNLDHITLSVTNRSSAAHGDSTSYAHIDAICIVDKGLVSRDTTCCDSSTNRINNGTFSNALSGWDIVPGSHPTPQHAVNDGFLQPGSAQLWGNQQFGEALEQEVKFIAGREYTISFAAANVFPQVGPGNVSIELRAATNTAAINNRTCPVGECETIYVTPILQADQWETFCIEWEPSQNYDRLILFPTNSSAAPSPDSISWGRIDDICIDGIITGIEDLIVEQNLTISPNPASHTLHLSYDFGDIRTYQLRLFDVYGRQIQQFHLQGNGKYDLDISRLTPGVYVLQREGHRGIKFVKQ